MLWSRCLFQSLELLLSRFGLLGFLNDSPELIVHIIGITTPKYIDPAHCIFTIPVQLLNILTNKTGKQCRLFLKIKMCMCTPPSFRRETIFVISCLLTWRTKSSPPPQKKGLLLKKRIRSGGSNSFLYVMTPIYVGGKATMKMTELLPLKVYPFTLRYSHGHYNTKHQTRMSFER